MRDQGTDVEPMTNTASPRPLLVELGDAAADVLNQLFLKGPTWDGDVSSKSGRDQLVEYGLASRYGGYQQLTRKGLEVAIKNGLDHKKEARERELAAALSAYRSA